jgi:squalene-hopene/tetraprenyl-beta-curcumene cyclase
MGLMAGGMADHLAVSRGIQFLVETQTEDGKWEETEFTGTGFPRVFYLRYHLYPVYFPLLALSQWACQAHRGAAEHDVRRIRLAISDREEPVLVGA